MIIRYKKGKIWKLVEINIQKICISDVKNRWIRKKYRKSSASKNERVDERRWVNFEHHG